MMDMDANGIGMAIVVGAGATLFMDIWAHVLKTAFAVPAPNYCFVGRWLCHMPAGRFRHPNIATGGKMPGECAVGWVFHYLVGMAYGLLLVACTGDRWLVHPTLLPALLLGVVTVVVPFLIMQPAFGFGIAASKTPNPTQARLKSLMSHSVFGIGLYLAALLVP
jgi:hypothetical protein